jgi:hypothetical protein
MNTSDKAPKLELSDSDTTSITIHSTGQLDRTKRYVVEMGIDTQVSTSEKSTLTR